jgi:hypothetical protein
MAFGQPVKQAAYARANGQCECMRQSCMAHYAGRCARSLVDGWHAHRIGQAGPDTLENCEALCIPCYEAEIARPRPVRFNPRPSRGAAPALARSPATLGDSDD